MNAATPPPHDATAAQASCHAKEAAVIGTLANECPDQLPPKIDKLLQAAPESFDDLRFGRAAVAIRQLRAETKPVAVFTIREHITGISDTLFLNDLSAVPLAIAEYEATDLLESYQRRRTKTALSDAVQAMEAAPEKWVSIVEVVRHSLDHLGREHANGDLPPIVDAAEFLATPFTPSREIVKGLAHEGSKVSLGGASKSFKTWTLLDMGVSVGHGLPWLSFDTTKSRVLFLNFEVQPEFFQSRIAAVARAKGIEVEPGQIEICNLRGRATSYTTIIPKIIERVKGGGHSLIILDPIYKLYGNTDENSAGAVAQLLNSLERLATETGAAIAFGAHYSKGNQSAKESIDRVSGSGVFARDPDSILSFTKHEEDDAFTVEATLRNFRPVEPFVVRWEYPLMRRDDTLDASKLKQAKGRPTKHSAAKLVEILRGFPGGMNSVKWQQMAQSEKGIGKSTFYELLPEAKEIPGVEKTQSGQWIYKAPHE